jgi:hypothetical protein
MEAYTTGFLRAALLWLVLGVSVGVAMAVHPAWCTAPHIFTCCCSASSR